jgi:hypothetical protein
MSAIYLKHPRHGTKVATGEAEAVYDESHGWERYDVNASAPAPPPEPPVAAVSNVFIPAVS